MLRQMAEDFSEDAFFSEVHIEETEEKVELNLTVALPGINTSRRMERKFDNYKTEYRLEHMQEGADAYIMISSDPNYELLVSYGDLHKDNGMYAYLMIFFFVFGVITVASVLVLGAVFEVSTFQRERDFALLLSVGTDKRQMKGMVLLESALYVVFALPAGCFLGILLFVASKEQIDNLLSSLERFPPVTLVISVPYLVILVMWGSVLIVGAAWKSMKKVERLRPIQAMRQSRDIYVPERKRVRQKEMHADEKIRVVHWLAKKNQIRFQKRYRPIIGTMIVTIVLCYMLNGFQKYTTEVVDMMYGGNGYNVSIELYSDNLEGLESLAGKIKGLSDSELYAIREIELVLSEPYPLSETGAELDIRRNFVQIPTVVLISADGSEYEDVFDSARTEVAETGEIEGIYIDTDRVWMLDGVAYKDKLFALSDEDACWVYRNYGFGSAEEKIKISVVGCLSEFPLYTEIEEPTRMAMLVTRETIVELEREQASVHGKEGQYYVSIRGNVEDADEFAKEAKRLIDRQGEVWAEVNNYAEMIRKENASISGFRFLMTGFALMIAFVCVCGNFIVSWTVGRTRKKEFAILASVGLTPEEIRGVRLQELLMQFGKALMLGTLLGILTYQCIYYMYSQEYRLDWCAPWEGAGMSLLVVAISIFLAELTLQAVLKNNTIAEAFREDGM